MLGTQAARVGLFGVSLALLFGMGAPARAQEGPTWDQRRVTQVAESMRDALRVLRADPELEVAQGSALQDRKHHAAISSVRRLAEMTDTLVERLRRGDDRDRTRPFFERIRLMREEIREYAGASYLRPETREKADRVVARLAELALYYPRYP